MPTLNPTKIGWVQAVKAGHTAARDATSGTGFADGPTTAQTGLGYQAVASGRGLQYTIRRLFLSFKTNTVTQTLASANIQIRGSAANSKPTILVPSTAFGGSNQSLSNNDYDNLTFNTTYNSGLSTWASGINEYSLNNTALTDIQNNGYFIVAIIQEDNDFDDVDIGGRGGTINFGVDFTQSIKLNYTLGGGGPTNVGTVFGIDKDDIGKVTGIGLNTISKITGIS